MPDPIPRTPATPDSAIRTDASRDAATGQATAQGAGKRSSLTHIPILNVYFLLCYALGRVQEQDMARLHALGECQSVQDLLGKLLAGGVNHLVRRGIDRGYVERREDLAGIRGKLAVSETAKRALRTRGRAACDFEELSVDIPPNRILRSSLRRLLSPPVNLDKKIRAQVRAAYRRLDGVSHTRLRRSAFHHIRLGGNRRLYRFLLSVCRLLHDNMLVDERTGTATFRDFRRDKKTMWALFEEFAAGFYRREAKAYRVRSKQRIRWAGSGGATEADKALIPVMEADLILESRERLLESGKRRIILDTKFYRETLGGRGKLHSNNLYQLLAYLRNREATMQGEAKPGGPRHDGILLYPQVGEPLRAHIRLEGFEIRARTVDLNRDWREIHDEMLAVVGC